MLIVWLLKLIPENIFTIFIASKFNRELRWTEKYHTQGT